MAKKTPAGRPKVATDEAAPSNMFDVKDHLTGAVTKMRPKQFEVLSETVIEMPNGQRIYRYTVGNAQKPVLKKTGKSE
jgi:hypothetical protein